MVGGRPARLEQQQGRHRNQNRSACRPDLAAARSAGGRRLPVTISAHGALRPGRAGAGRRRAPALARGRPAGREGRAGGAEGGRDGTRAPGGVPSRATDHNNREVTDRILTIDRTYPDTFRMDRRAGFAEMHHLTLEFPDGVTRLRHPVLFLYGWVDFEYSSSNYAAYQAGVQLTAPVLEMEDKDDRVFRPVLDPMGFPPGLPRMISVDLSGLAPLSSRRRRAPTNVPTG